MRGSLVFSASESTCGKPSIKDMVVFARYKCCNRWEVFSIVWDSVGTADKLLILYIPTAMCKGNHPFYRPNSEWYDLLWNSCLCSLSVVVCISIRPFFRRRKFGNSMDCSHISNRKWILMRWDVFWDYFSKVVSWALISYICTLFKIYYLSNVSPVVAGSYSTVFRSFQCVVGHKS